MSDDPFADDLVRKGVQPAGDDPFAADLAAKQKAWEASPKYAALKAKHDATVAKTEALRNSPSVWDPTQAENLKSMGASFLQGAGAVGSDELNMATLGAYKPIRDYVLKKTSPSALADVQASEAGARETPGYPLISGIGQAGAAGLGAPGAIARSMASAARPILSSAASGAVQGGLQSSVESAGRGESLGQNLKATGIGAAAGGATGLALGGVSKLLSGAPERVAESELGGLKEGVQNKTRILKFEPNEDSFRTALAAEPKLRALAKNDPVAARPEFHRMVEEKANALLNPLYDRLRASGNDLVPVDTIENQLKAVRSGFNRVTEKAQIANVDEIIDDMHTMNNENGGHGIPAQFVRETATSFGKTGFKNLPMLEAPGAAKQLKQEVSGALREAIADHIESITPNTAAGKALRQNYEDANREVSTWIKMRDIVDEKARRLAGNATPMADVLSKVAHAGMHPKMTAAKIILGAGPEAADRAIAPIMTSRFGRAAAPWADAATVALPSRIGGAMGGNPLVNAAQAQRQRDEEAAASLRGQGP